jgi:hypothetical protein
MGNMRIQMGNMGIRNMGSNHIHHSHIIGLHRISPIGRFAFGIWHTVDVQHRLRYVYAAALRASNLNAIRKYCIRKLNGFARIRPGFAMLLDIMQIALL